MNGSTVLWIVLIVVVIAVVIAALMLMRGRAATARRAEAQDLREQAGARSVEVDRREAEAAEVAARARQAQAEADAQAARAAQLQADAQVKQEDATATRQEVQEHLQRADELDPQAAEGQVDPVTQADVGTEPGEQDVDLRGDGEPATTQEGPPAERRDI